MDVLNIIINPSEKAECGNGTALPEVPPGAVPGEDTRAGRARPEPSALPQCDWPWRNRTSSSTPWSWINYFGPSVSASRFSSNSMEFIYGISRLLL
jgi:hypothetical protein